MHIARMTRGDVLDALLPVRWRASFAQSTRDRPAHALARPPAVAGTTLCAPALCPPDGDARVYRPSGPLLAPPDRSPQPRINGPKIFGARPGHPFLFRIAATGSRPMRFSATGLPAGLSLDAKTGIISGKATAPGDYEVELHATNGAGHATQTLRIKIGETIALTPPMGWNSWNCWAENIDEGKVRAAAKAMVDSGLANHGWTYVNIDDAWQGERGGPHNAIQPNEKFDDMKALADYVHGLGLKLGIYSTPWITSYAGYRGGSSNDPAGTWKRPLIHVARMLGWRIGRHTFEKNDAKQWAQWGIDYLKYDWRPNGLVATRRMAEALRGSGRDVVYSLSNTAPLRNAKEYAKLANLWRTTSDITDAWSARDRPEIFSKSLLEIWRSHGAWQSHNGPGHWNDPDMLVVGPVGWGEIRDNRLSQEEQLTHMTLWCLWSAPLLIGCPLEQLDDFTISLLSNDEVLQVNQDPLGRQAQEVARQEDCVVIAKDLEDGSKAVGLFNTGSEPSVVTAKWSDLGLQGPRQVRDLWRRKSLGVRNGELAAEVAPHSVVFVRIEPPHVETANAP